MGWMADIGMEVFQERCLATIDKRIAEVQKELTVEYSIPKENYLKGLKEARNLISKESPYS